MAGASPRNTLAMTFLAFAHLQCAKSDGAANKGLASSQASTEACALPTAPVTSKASDRNVQGKSLEVCSTAPLTGFFRDGRCSTGEADRGVHVVCSEMNAEFLAFTKGRGNDLSTARGDFAGLRAGDRWCLCAARWEEARSAGVAPKVVLGATHEAALTVTQLSSLVEHRIP